jgi:osmotically-inducible protein OsmY
MFRCRHEIFLIEGQSNARFTANRWGLVRSAVGIPVATHPPHDDFHQEADMTLASLSATDFRVRDAVLQELAWDSAVDASAIGVAAKSGAVTLTGFVDSYAGKLAAERAAKRVRGVRAVANDVQVRLRLDRSDEEIASDAALSLGMRLMLPEDVQVVVHGGHLTLTGSVSSLFQRAVAEEAVHNIKGVKSLVNRIKVKPVASLRDIQREIVGALHRDADINAKAIEVGVTGNQVRLTGTVGTWRERESAERAAAHATGIALVDNKIVVKANEESGDDTEEIC